MTYGIRYPVSIAYYSDLRPARLMQTEADIEEVRPHKMSWTATNIMPFAAVEDMNLQKDTLLVTDWEHAKELGTKVPGAWQEVGSSYDYVVYRLKPDVSYDGHVELPGRKNDISYGILEQYLLGTQTNKLQDS